MRASWKVRPDCEVKGCTNEAANKKGWCIAHHPHRCIARVTETAAARADGTEQCRSVAKKGYDKCWRHLK